MPAGCFGMLLLDEHTAALVQERDLVIALTEQVIASGS